MDKALDVSAGEFDDAVLGGDLSFKVGRFGGNEGFDTTISSEINSEVLKKDFQVLPIFLSERGRQHAGIGASGLENKVSHGHFFGEVELTDSDSQMEFHAEERNLPVLMSLRLFKSGCLQPSSSPF